MFDCCSTRCPDLEYLYRRARQLLPVDAVDDVVQEAALAAWKMRETRKRAGVRTWLNGILRHKIADFYQRDPGWLWEMMSDDLPQAVDIEDAHLLRMVLFRIPRDYTSVLWMRFYAGLTLEEVGMAMGISAEAARGRYRRAMGALREEWMGCQAQMC